MSETFVPKPRGDDRRTVERRMVESNGYTGVERRASERRTFDRRTTG